MKGKIKIIGCGVSGLTVGLVLLEAGYDVEIITKDLPADTTSAKAAAIWFPYEVLPKEKANKWSKESYDKFVELYEVPAAGVSMVSLTVLVNKVEDAWWTDALPSSELRRATLEELPTNFPIGFKVNVPLAETQIYLDYLLYQFNTLGGRISIKKVENLDELEELETIIINCTGLSSRELVNDTKLYPIHGQIVKAKSQPGINCIGAEFTFDGSADKVAYIVPRKDCLVLGGTITTGKEDTEPNAAITKGIIERCKVLEPNLDEIQIQSVEVGLRPGRSEIRLERVGNIIHNYGHGGGGFTVSWGCATEVKRLIEDTHYQGKI